MPAISASEAITSTSARKIAQPFTQPVAGPNARVVHANVVPAAGADLFRYRDPRDGSSIGPKDASSTAGAWVATPGSATMKPRVAASEYAGAVDATPMT